VITAQHFDGTTSVELIKINLLGGYTMQFVWDSGWNVLDSNGNVLTGMGLIASGTDKSIQFNDGGNIIGGDSNITWDKSANEFGLNGTDTSIILNGITNEPAGSSSNNLRIYSKNVSGRMLPKWVGPSGIDTPFQPALFGNTQIFYTPSSGTTVTLGFGTTWAKGGSAGTVSTPTPTSTVPVLLNSLKRTRHVNAATTQNQSMGIICTAAGSPQFWRGNSSGLGGWFFFARFGIAAWASGSRIFCGMTPGTAEVVSSDTMQNNTIGLWKASFDSGSSLSFISRDTVGTYSTAISGSVINGGSVFDVYMYAKPNDSTVYFRVDMQDNGSGSLATTLINSSITNNLPTSTVFLGPQVVIGNGATNTTVGTVGIDVNRIYIESDR
jgi:hypothetical protein